MGHPPYSSDSTPSDFRLFLRLKKFLGGKRFDDDDDLKDAVQKCLTSQAAAFYEEGIQKLVPRYDKYLNNGGEYMGKFYTKPYSIFLLQRNGTYFLHKPRKMPFRNRLCVSSRTAGDPKLQDETFTTRLGHKAEVGRDTKTVRLSDH